MKTLILILALAASVFAQTTTVKPCPLTLEQSPEVRGLKLLQRYEARPRLVGAFDALADEPDEIGLREVSISNYGER